MTDSRNILIDVVFAKDSLTKISSADMREFVNYVYNEHMNKDNIADNLTTKSSSITLSANQGVVLESHIEDTNVILTQTNTDIKVLENDINQNRAAIDKNIIDNTDINTTLIGVQGDLSGNRNLLSALDNKVQKLDVDAQNLETDFNVIDENLNNTGGIYDRIEANEIDIEDIKKVLNKDNTDINTIVSDINQNKIDIKKVHDVELPNISSRITNIATDTSTEIAKVKAEVSNFANGINNNETRISNNATAIISAQTAISNQNLNFTQMNQDISTIENNVANILQWENTISASEKGIQAARTEISQNETLSKLNEKRLDKQKLDDQHQDQRISLVETTLNKTATKANGNEKSIIAIQTINTQIQSSLGLLQSDHKALGTSTAQALSASQKVSADLILSNKLITVNSSNINTNKININATDAEVTILSGRVSTTEVQTGTNIKDIKDINTKQTVARQDIYKNQTDITSLKTNHTFPGLLSKKANDQLIIQGATGAGANVSIQAQDASGTDVWSIGSTSGNAFDALEIKAETITLKTKNLQDLKLEAQDPNNPSKTSTHHFLTFDDNHSQNINNGDFIWYQNNEWEPLPQADILTKLDVFTQQETHDEIQQFWDVSIADFETVYLDNNYYQKTEVYTKVEVDDALTHQVGNKSLGDYGADFNSSSFEYKAWENLKNYNPQSAPGLMAETPAGSSQDIATLETEIIELQRYVNELVTLLSTSGVLQ